VVHIKRVREQFGTNTRARPDIKQARSLPVLRQWSHQFRLALVDNGRSVLVAPHDVM
jgi:hypothetical protein